MRIDSMREYYVIRCNDDAEWNAGKFLERLGSYFLYFEEDLFLAMRFEAKEDAEKVLDRYTLTDCKVRKVQMTLGMEPI